MTNELPHLSLTDRVITVTRSQIGNQEIPKGSNWGKHVQKYLASVGIGFAASWCMAFVYWCYQQACKEMGIENPLVKTGGVLRLWNEVPKRYKSKVPKRGCIFIMDYGKGLGHTGIVERIDGDTLYTIEGNTNDEGSREGYEVCRRTRSVSKCVGFIHIDS